MRGLKSIAAGVLVMASVAGHAAAADVTPHPPVITADSVMPTEAESGGGWYLRGDVGVADNVAPTISWQSSAYGNRLAPANAALGVGVGYRFSENLRSDVTLDFLTDHRVKGYLNATTDDHLSQGATTLMANGYYDIGIYMGLTPYIGAGLGVARVSDGTLTREIAGAPTYSFASVARYSLAASGMTGVSFDIAHGLQADVGYKFTWIGGTRTGLETTSTLAGPVHIGDTMSHQMRIGLKYFIN